MMLPPERWKESTPAAEAADLQRRKADALDWWRSHTEEILEVKRCCPIQNEMWVVWGADQIIMGQGATPFEAIEAAMEKGAKG